MKSTLSSHDVYIVSKQELCRIGILECVTITKSIKYLSNVKTKKNYID